MYNFFVFSLSKLPGLQVIDVYFQCFLTPISVQNIKANCESLMFRGWYFDPMSTSSFDIAAKVYVRVVSSVVETLLDVTYITV
jgi:hypothetical protein